MHQQGDSRLTPSMQHKSHYDIRQTQQCVHGRDISAPLHYKQRVEAEEQTLFSPLIGQVSSNRHSHWLKTTLYYSLIEPYSNYCVIIFGGAFDTYVRSLEVVQRRSIRIICGENSRAHSNPIFSNLGIIKFKDLYR